MKLEPFCFKLKLLPPHYIPFTQEIISCNLTKKGEQPDEKILGKNIQHSRDLSLASVLSVMPPMTKTNLILL